MEKTIIGNKLTRDCYEYDFGFKNDMFYTIYRIKCDIYNEDGVLLARKGEEATEEQVAKYKELYIEYPHHMSVHVANGYPGAPYTELGINIHTKDMNGELIQTTVFFTEEQIAKIVERFEYVLKENAGIREYERKAYKEYLDKQAEERGKV